MSESNEEMTGSWDGARILTLGRGEVSVTAAYQPHEEGETAMLLLEPGLGSSEIGGEVLERPAGKAVYPVAGSVVLIFEHPGSVQVVIDKLEEIKESLVQRLVA